MGAEVGATTTIFPYTSGMRSYLQATGRRAVADAADEAASLDYLNADNGAEYTEVIEVVCNYEYSFFFSNKWRIGIPELIELGAND